jgi:hypothetical protein
MLWTAPLPAHRCHGGVHGLLLRVLRGSLCRLSPRGKQPVHPISGPCTVDQSRGCSRRQLGPQGSTEPMNDHRRIKVFLDVLGRFLSRTVAQAWSHIAAELGPKETVALTNGLYFCIERSGLTLVSAAAGDSQSMKLSVDEAKQIFSSIESACTSRDIVKVRTGELSWTTDARPKSDPEKVIIKLTGPLGYTRTDARRKDVAAAVVEFANRFRQRQSP